MQSSISTQQTVWPWWRKITFRFFFILLALFITPWDWVSDVPVIGYVSTWYEKMMDWLVDKSNQLVFHVRPVLVPLNGSGDTSYGWAALWLMLSLALIGCIIWSLSDRKRSNYIHLNYWLCLFTRYYVALIAFIYGVAKIFAMQMVFPNMHQLATPLGDLLPMRFSWFFIGYSTPYQVFSGVMEVIAGLLLLNRRTSTLGILIATGVFINVMMLNLCYDIPVKIFSMQMVFICFFLLVNESNRMICFFILNKPAAVCDLYHFRYTKKWMRITRWVLKGSFIFLFLVMAFYNDYQQYKSGKQATPKQPVPNGVYEVKTFAINKDSLPLKLSDTLRWQDVIFENGSGSIKTRDTSFRIRYNRAYFSYGLDSAVHTLFFKKQYGDSLPLLSFRFDTPDSNTIRLWGKQRNDSLYIVLAKTPRHFQLAEKQFHWLSEYNR